MFGFLKQMFTFKKREEELVQRLNRYDELLKTYSERVQQSEAKIQQQHEELQVFITRDEQERAKRDGKDPWVEIRSADFNDVKGIQIELDWNDAFIEYLKDNGIKGRDDETIVQKWVAMLYHDLMEKLEHAAIDNSDKIRPSDYM